MGKSINKEKDLLVTITKVRELEEKNGHVSCFDAPTVYREMGQMQEKIRVLATELSQKADGVSDEAMYRIYEDMAKDAKTVYQMNADDIVKNIDKGIIDFQLYNLDEFLNTYVLSDGANELYKRMFNISDIQTRVDFLKDNYLCDLDIYYTRFLDYLVLFKVDEDAWESLKGEKHAA